MAGLLVAMAAIPIALGGVVAGSLLSIPFVALTPIPVQFSVAGGLIAAGCLVPMLLGLGGFSFETARVQASIASFFLVAGTILLLASFGGLIATGIFGSPNAGETLVGIIISFGSACVLSPCLVCCGCLLDDLQYRLPDNGDQCMNTQTQVPSGNPTFLNFAQEPTQIKSKLQLLRDADSNENNPAPVKLGEGITMSQGGDEPRSTQGTANNNQDVALQSANSLESNAAEFHEVGSGTCISSNDGEVEGDVL